MVRYHPAPGRSPQGNQQPFLEGEESPALEGVLAAQSSRERGGACPGSRPRWAQRCPLAPAPGPSHTGSPAGSSVVDRSGAFRQMVRGPASWIPPQRGRLRLRAARPPETSGPCKARVPGAVPPRWSGCVPLRPGTFLPARPGAVSVRPSVWSAGAMLWVTWSWQGAGQTRSRGQAVKVDCALPGKTRSRHPPKGWRSHHQPAGLRLQKAEGCVHALQETEPRGRGRGVHSPPDAGAEASALLHDRPAAPED